MGLQAMGPCEGPSKCVVAKRVNHTNLHVPQSNDEKESMYGNHAVFGLAQSAWPNGGHHDGKRGIRHHDCRIRTTDDDAKMGTTHLLGNGTWASWAHGLTH